MPSLRSQSYVLLNKKLVVKRFFPYLCLNLFILEILSNSQSNTERIHQHGTNLLPKLLVFQTMKYIYCVYYNRTTLGGQSTAGIIFKLFLPLICRMVKNPPKGNVLKDEYINSRHRNSSTPKHLHCGDEMQYKVLGGQTVSQEGMCEEPKQLCSNW